MTLLREVGAELAKMFAADWRLSVATLAVVAVAALLSALLGDAPLVVGGALTLGVLGLLLESIRRGAGR